MCRLLRVLLIRFPDRRFVFVGDSGYGSHEVARFAHRHRDRLTLVSKLHPEANLFEPPPPYGGKGRPRVKGERRPKPSQAVAATPVREGLSVAWYGGGDRRVEVVTGTGQWYKAGEGLVPIGWVFVHDRDGTHRDEYFYATDPDLDAATIIGRYTSRWSIETTFQELRCHLGLETTRGWCRTRSSRCCTTPCPSRSDRRG
jgi:hypothetical protein